MESFLSVAGIAIAVRTEGEPQWTWEEPVSRFLVRHPKLSRFLAHIPGVSRFLTLPAVATVPHIAPT